MPALPTSVGQKTQFVFAPSHGFAVAGRSGFAAARRAQVFLLERNVLPKSVC